MKRKRSVSEIISYLVLFVATVIAFSVVLVVVPRFFSVYSAVALKASYSQSLEGYQTSASLSRADRPGQTYITVIIYNGGVDPVRVNYYVECVRSDTSAKYFVGKEENVLITADSTYYRVYTVSSGAVSGYICYLTVEEPNLLLYKVVES